MNSIGFLSTIYVVLVSLIIVIVLFILSYRIYSVLIEKQPRKNILNSNLGLHVKLLKIGFGISMVLIIVITPLYAYVGSVFKSIIPAGLNHTLVIVILCMAAFEGYLSLSASEKLQQTTFKKIVLTMIALVMLPLSVYSTIFVPALFEFPDAEESHIVQLPVRGTWTAGHAGGSEATNYHNALKSQQYAIDIVKVNGQGRFYEDEGSELDDVFSFGEPVYSPVDGVVVAVTDTLPNSNITLAPADSINPAGNHLVIEFETDRYLFLAHFEPYTIQIDKGDTIKAGEFIGNIGNSGNTSWPHLHMHIQDSPTLDNKNATGYPFRFDTMKRKRWLTWRTVDNGPLTRNDYFRDLKKSNE